MAEHERLSRWLAAGRRRLRARAALRGSAIGATVGAALGVIGVAVARLVFASSVPAAIALALVLPLGLSAMVALASAVRWAIDARGVALVLDKVGETDERLITALHLAEHAPDDARTRSALAELEDLEIDALARRLPVRWPRAARATPLLVVAALGLVLLPAGRFANL
ncbi:MAG: hypothetical protein AAF211_19580, partial [Myxococcota bacterium]